MLRDLDSSLEADTRGGSPGLAGRTIAAHQRKRPDRAGPAIMSSVNDQELAAPDRAVVAMPRAIPRNPQRGSLFAMLGQARQNMGMMVLDGDQGQARSCANLVVK